MLRPSRHADPLQGRSKQRPYRKEPGLEVELFLNGEARTIAAGETLLDLLAALKRDPRTVAVEKNGRIVPRSEYGAAPLAAGDRIEIVHFVQGG